MSTFVAYLFIATFHKSHLRTEIEFFWLKPAHFLLEQKPWNWCIIVKKNLSQKIYKKVSI